MKYVLLAVPSDTEAQRLIEDLSEHSDEPLRTPRWGNAVHAVRAVLMTGDHRLITAANVTPA